MRLEERRREVRALDRRVPAEAGPRLPRRRSPARGTPGRFAPLVGWDGKDGDKRDRRQHPDPDRERSRRPSSRTRPSAPSRAWSRPPTPATGWPRKATMVITAPTPSTAAPTFVPRRPRRAPAPHRGRAPAERDQPGWQHAEQCRELRLEGAQRRCRRRARDRIDHRPGSSTARTVSQSAKVAAGYAQGSSTRIERTTTPGLRSRRRRSTPSW